MQTAQFIIELLKAVFLGIVEGITEWLPISSTGHLILVNEFLNLRQSKDFIDMFNIVIQLGAILAVMVIYFKRLNPFQPGKTAREVQLTWQLWLKVVIACIPSAFFGLLLDDWMEAHLSNFFVVAIMLVVYGIAFIWIEDRNRRVEPKVTDLARMSYKTAFLLLLLYETKSKYSTSFQRSSFWLAPCMEDKTRVEKRYSPSTDSSICRFPLGA